MPKRAASRTKTWEGRVRRHYAEKFCPAVNHPADPHHFPALRRDPSRRRDRGIEVRVRDDPVFPVTRVARAISETVEGEEDRDWALYESAVRYLLLMLGKYPIVVAPALHIGCPSSAPEEPPQGYPPPVGHDQPHPFPTVRFGYESERWVAMNLSLTVPKKADWNSSAWLLQEFVRYELLYKDRLLRLGVCHNPLCERLYVKAKHSGSTQLYCNRGCGDSGRRHR